MVVDIPDKICPHCGDTLWSKQKSEKSKDGFRYRCLKEMREKSALWRAIHKEEQRIMLKKWSDSHKEYRKEYSKKYRKEKADEIRKQNKEYRLSNKDKVNKLGSKLQKKYRETLADSYVKTVIALPILQTCNIKIDKKTITKEQIEKCRQSLIAQRKLKQLKQSKQKTMEAKQLVKWSKEEDEKLISTYSSSSKGTVKLNITTFSNEIGRTYAATMSRLQHLRKKNLITGNFKNGSIQYPTATVEQLPAIIKRAPAEFICEGHFTKIEYSNECIKLYF